MVERKFSNELKKVFEYIKDNLLKEYPTDRIGVEYFISAVIDNDDCVANHILNKVMFSNNVENAREHFMTQMNCKRKENVDKTVYDDNFEHYINKSKILSIQQKTKVINSGMVLDAIVSNDADISKYFKSIGVMPNQIHMSSVDETAAISDEEKDNANANFVKSEPQKHERKPKPIKPQEVEQQNVVNEININVADTGGECAKLFDNLLTEYRNGKIDKFYGYEETYGKIFNVLAKRNKNNVVIVGKNGVGKTALVRNMASLIVNRQVPKMFLDKILLQVDFESLIVGTMMRGTFEAKVKAIMNDINRNGKYIMFIDNIGGVLDTSRNTNDDVDDFITKLLDNKNVMVIATCSSQDVKKINNSNKWSRLFETIKIEEPDDELCEDILSVQGEKLSYFHNVEYDENVYAATVKLCRRYITERSLPDSAIDVLDETGARISIQAPTEQNILDTERKLREIREEKEKIHNSTEKKDYNKIDELIDKEITLKSILSFAYKQHNMERKVSLVTLNDIKKTISQRTDIPLEEMSVDDKAKLKNINERIKKYVIGQDEAVDEVCRSIKRQRVGIGNPNKPVVFLTAGNTGVGKTYLAKMLAKEMFGDENNMIRLDMSEYSTDVSVTKIYGAPPSYVGYGDGGTLVDKLKMKKHCVLLLDEIDKANEKVYDVFLQMFDDGRLTDNKGNVVDCKNIIVIMTSNIGAKEVDERGSGIGFVRNEESNKKSIIEKELKRKFKPEFINRIDKIIYFNKLGEESLRKIITLEIGKVRDRIHDMGYDFDETIMGGEMVDRIYGSITENANYGARPIIREIRVQLEDKLTDYIIENEVEEGHIFNIKEIS